MVTNKLSTTKVDDYPVVIVFDLDETLGYFSEFSLLWNYLLSNQIKPISGIHLQFCFNDFFDKFPELLRPLIVDILKSLLRKKHHHCFEIMLYTNNNGNKMWVNHIVKYLEYKINKDFQIVENIFFKIIYAFKVNGMRVEPKRTTTDKTFGDFLSTTNLPDVTQNCFIDDTYYPEMDVKNVFYINVEPYVYHFNAIDMYKRIKQSKYFLKHYHHIDANKMINFLNDKLNLKTCDIIVNYDKMKHSIEIIDSKAIRKFLNEFLMEFCCKK